MSNETFNKSQSFVLPCLGISSYVLADNGFLESYLGDYNYSYSSDWGEFIYLLFDKEKLGTKLKNALERNISYQDQYYPELDKIMIVLKFPEYHKDNIVQPFIEGKYSHIDRDFVNTQYKSTIFTHGMPELSKN